MKDWILSGGVILTGVLGILNFMALKRLKRFDATLALERSKAEALHKEQSTLIREVDDLVQKLRVTMKTCEQEVRTGQNMSQRSQSLIGVLYQIVNDMGALHFRAANLFEESTVEVIGSVSSICGFVDDVFRKFARGGSWNFRYQAGQDFLTALPRIEEEVMRWKTEARRFHQSATAQ